MPKKILILIVSDNNMECIKNAVMELDNVDYADLLIVDDGSDYDIMSLLGKHKKVKCIRHEFEQGYGACIDTALNYARDMEYDYFITLDCETRNITNDIPEIVKNLDYGYDIVSCSRILENYNYEKIDKDILSFYETIAAPFNEETGLDFTDPLSGNKGFNVQATEHIVLTEVTHGIHIQLLIQGVFYGCSIIEIPSDSCLEPGKEINERDNLLDYFIALITTEKFLFNKGTIN